MIDTGSAFHALTLGGLRSDVLRAAAVGMLAGVSPCSGPRCAFLGIVIGGSSLRPSLLKGALFAIGMMACYAAVSVSGVAAARALDSPFAYLLIAAWLVVVGIRALVRASTGDDCARSAGTSAGVATLLGSLCGAIVSPCCTPLIAPLVAYAAGTEPLRASLIFSVLSLGQTMPPFVAALIATRCELHFDRIRRPAGVVCGAVSVALGAYYAVLA